MSIGARSALIRRYLLASITIGINAKPGARAGTVVSDDRYRVRTRRAETLLDSWELEANDNVQKLAWLP